MSNELVVHNESGTMNTNINDDDDDDDAKDMVDGIDSSSLEEEDIETPAQMKGRVCSMCYTELVVRHDYIIGRLADASSATTTTTATTTTSFLPTLYNCNIAKGGGGGGGSSKKDTHWDYVMKELMWLAADFASERKRQISQAKRLSMAVKVYHNSKLDRKRKEMLEQELKRRKLAAKIAREVKHFWNKIERVISYKQKVIAEQERHVAMDRHLLSLVKRTEEYGQSLSSTNNVNQQQQHTTSSSSWLTVEEVLQSSAKQTLQRMAKKLKIDYTQIVISNDDNELYGQSLISSPSDESSYHPDDLEQEDDDDSTFQEALSELNPIELSEEIQILLEESNKNVKLILSSYTTKYVEANNNNKASPTVDDSSSSSSSTTVVQKNKRIRIVAPSIDDATATSTCTVTATTHDVTIQPSYSMLQSSSAAAEAATNSDGNLVLLYKKSKVDEDNFLKLDSASDGSEEFEIDPEDELDDEATLEAEERLGKEMSTEEEIAMLQRENEVPIEELLELYARMNNTTNKQEQSSSSDDDDGSEEFVIDQEDEVNDETTLEAEERLGKEMTTEEELAMLQRENEVPIEELLELYAQINNNKKQEEEEQSVSSDGSEEFVVDQEEEEVDDETTLEVEERLGKEMSTEEELAMLERENEVPIEELLASYTRMVEENESTATSTYSSESKEEMDYHKLLLGPSEEKDVVVEEQQVSIIKALEDSDKRARETNVTRPFILSSWVKLRPYQQIGLNWLVSLQSRRLNGILADEMGLGKTLQTISMLAYLAAYHGIWGPHLIIVPTSVILNWETEIKRFCPSFKVLCYYGSAKRRKELRQGWTRTNWHHIVVTSYQLAVQDSFAFKRKRWYYLILDEAHHIKNFQSQRWQTLINFNTQRRLLLTGTPLQNNLMELWSLLHFLMPHIFRDRKEFSYWFSNPMNQIIEGNASRNDELISRLHGIIRPFVLRRLKKDVEKQMPGKFEHIVKCQLSRRQMFLYEEFMGRSSTRVAVKKGGIFLGMMNVLMQLRKVCNHPDLFEPRSILTPFFMESLSIRVPGFLINALEPSSMESVSAPLIHHLWSKGCGIPSFDSTLQHDAVTAAQLQSLQSPRQVVIESLVSARITDQPACDGYSSGLRTLLTSIWVAEKEEAVSNAETAAAANSSRCQCEAFPYSSRVLNAVTIDNIFSLITKCRKDDLSSPKIAETPTQLLELLRTEQERSEEFDTLIERFVFCVPRAGARRPILETNCVSTFPDQYGKPTTLELTERVKRYFYTFKKPAARLTSFFPEQKLVQFDAGKLIVLAELLRELKKGGHRVLIFTQMNKMLDILESFVNLHGITYLRLDGSVPVEERQRLMDRFNNDPKIFCFILSTRSGGLGINLTGADTVVFYDSDWCPSIDAQAQDRAHRIGQTREVHIYRLVTEHTIEENILLRARQKRQLDFLVMDEGKFHATSGTPTKESDAQANESVQELFTKEGLRDILGVTDKGTREEEEAEEYVSDEAENSQQEVSKEQLEQTMAALEDEDDAIAKLGAEKEAAGELQEFDESIQFVQEAEDDGEAENQESQGEDASQDDDRDTTVMSKKSNIMLKRKASDDEGDSQAEDSLTEASDAAEMEKEFEAWQSKVGINLFSISESLTPAERYALNFKEEIDSFYSDRYLADWRRMTEEESTEQRWDTDEIEEAKAEEERRAIEDGDLLVTKPIPKDLLRQKLLYLREKARLRAAKKRRILTGENWCMRLDGVTNYPFWYNTDTGEAIWDKPLVLIELEAEELARKKLWNALPIKSLIHVMSYIIPYPDRMQCAKVCKQWRLASVDISFVRHVWPVECGALTMEKAKLDRNHYVSIEDALSVSYPGDTIELSDGHYWVKEPGLLTDFPVRFVGDENDPSHVVIELSGSICWKGSGGWIEGVTVRRPRLANDQSAGQEIITVEGKVDINHCIFNNSGHLGDVVSLRGKGHKGRWNDVIIKGAGGKCSGLSLQNAASFYISNSTMEENGGYGVMLKDSSIIQLVGCKLVCNGLRPIFISDTGSFISSASENNLCDDISSLPLPGFSLDEDEAVFSESLKSEMLSKQRSSIMTSGNPVK